MDKLLTFPGEMPIYLGDIDFMQSAIRETLVNLLIGLTGQSNPKCILKYATENEPGVICMNGEILPLKPQSGKYPGAICYKVVSVYSGDRTFKSGDIHQCHEQRYAEAYVGSTEDEFYVQNFPHISELLNRAGISQDNSVMTYEDDTVSTRINVSSVGKQYVINGTATLDKETFENNPVICNSVPTTLPVGSWTFPVFKQSGTIYFASLTVSIDSSGRRVATIRTSINEDENVSKIYFSFCFVNI